MSIFLLWQLSNTLSTTQRYKTQKHRHISQTHSLRQLGEGGLCCMDNTSSAEQSEAINSMYRWCQLAHVCYVYLEDVEGSPLHGAEISLVGKLGFQIELAKARWFTRGWTLQEFLAS